MKRRLMIKFVSAALVLLALPHVSAHVSSASRLATAIQEEGGAEQDWPKQERIDRSYRLSPGARVEASMIYGPVDIETGYTDLAEVHIVRYAQASEDLASRKISVEQTATGLVIRGKEDRSA